MAKGNFPSKEGRDKKHPLFDISPGWLLAIVVLVIFLAEAGERLILSNFPPASQMAQVFLDMASMMVVLWPAYFFLYRPFQSQWLHGKRMGDDLRKSEERLKFAMEAVNDGVWDWIVPTGEVYFSPRWQTMLGYEPGELPAVYQTWESRLHPEDKEKTVRVLMDHVEGRTTHYETEHRLRAKGGNYVWIHDRGRVVERDAAGKPLRVTGTHTDITKRKQAEAEIRHLTRQLLTTSEEERKALARDLHDEFGQILTALQFGMETLKNSLPEEAAGPQAQCNKLSGMIARLGDDVRNVCAHLRPAMLDDMGLVSTLKRDIDTLREQWQGIRIDFTTEGMEERLCPETEIAFYRICQEGLNNIARHAQAKHVELTLKQIPPLIVLTIRDDGEGFDPEGPSYFESEGGQWGIGLLGMRERTEAIGGNLTILSARGEGTTVRVEIPIELKEGKWIPSAC